VAHKHSPHKHSAKKYVAKKHGGKMKKNVIFLPFTNERSASSRIRVYQNARALEKLGWHCSIGANTKHDPRNYSIVVFQKRYKESDMRLAQSCGGKVVFDVSDPYWLKGRAGPLKQMGKIARVVTTSSGRQTKWFRSQGIKAVTIPNGFDFREVPSVPKREKLTFCWIGNLTNEPNLKIIVNPLNRLYQTVPFDFWIITRKKGARIPKFSFPVRMIPWTQQTAFHYMAQCHIGVSPRILDSWNLAKSSYKAIAYMALGLAIIATPIFSIQGVIFDAKNGFLVEKNDPDEWYQKLRILALEKDVRESMAEAGRETAKSFSIDAIARKWDKLFRTL